MGGMPVVPREVVPEQLRKFVDAASPIAMRTMAAKGLVPIPPKDLVFVQCVLADRHRFGRVFLAGDAAHRQTPTTG